MERCRRRQSAGKKQVKLFVRFFSTSFLALPLLLGCVTVTVDEKTAFQPPKRHMAPATTVAELDARFLVDRVNAGITERLWRIEATGDGGTKLTFRSDGPLGRRAWPLPPPTIFRHNFIGEGQRRIATTLYTRETSNTVQRPIVVHCGGNATDRYDSFSYYVGAVLDWADVLTFDYPGYGDTLGPANAANFEASAQTLSNYATSLGQNRKLVFWGHSLGGFVCSRLAAQTPEADGLILETTAPNAAAVARAWTPSYARLFVRAKVAPSLAGYDVVEAAARVKGLVLVLGATKDKVLPVALARQVADGLKSRDASITYHEFPNARHENVPNQADYEAVISAYFSKIESQP
jgi:predicted esterase